MRKLRSVAAGFASVAAFAMVAWLGQSGISAGPALQSPEEGTWNPMFPRPGATLVFENDRAVVWQQRWDVTQSRFMYRNVRDVLVFIEHEADGVVEEPGKPSRELKIGAEGRFFQTYARAGQLGPHAEWARDAKNPPTGYFVELKGTEPPGLVNGRWPKSAPPTPRTAPGDQAVLPVSVATNDTWNPQFPRPFSTKVFENERVRVWKSVYDPSQSRFMHRHIFDILVFMTQGGWAVIETPNTPPREMCIKTGFQRYVNAGMGPHAEWAKDPKSPPTGYFVELKDTQPAGVVDGRWPKSAPTNASASGAAPLNMANASCP